MKSRFVQASWTAAMLASLSLGAVTTMSTPASASPTYEECWLQWECQCDASGLCACYQSMICEA